MNAQQTEQAGSGVHIAVLDTLGEPPEELCKNLDIVDFHDGYVDEPRDDPVGHGTTVVDLLGATAPSASYSTFQVVEAEEVDGEIETAGNRGDIAQAVIDAADAGVDVINISLGMPHECGGHCSLSRESALAADNDDVCIVAATGNHDQTVGRTGVHCPALSDSVIGVGGYLPLCTAEIVRDSSSVQWWVENDEIVGPFCGQRGCYVGGSCEDHRKEVLWSGNVSFHNCAPDVLAPVLEVHGNANGEIAIQPGTSFGTPLVSGSIAGILGDVAGETDPSAEELRRAVRLGSTPIDEGGYNKFDMGGTWRLIAERS